MSYQPRTILVTGGAGFIGTNFIRYLLTHESNVQIINLDKLTYAGSLHNLKNLPHAHQHHFVQGDIADKNLLTQLFTKYDIDTIVHFAAESHVDRSITTPESFVQTNVMGTFTLLETARHYWQEVKKFSNQQCRFHHISTDEVYGSLALTDFPFTENHRYQPRSPYSATKAASDHLVAAYFNTYNLPITISHCSNNYGPYQHAEKFIPTIIHACLTWRTIPVYGNGKNIRDWLYVTDHCAGILAIIKRGQLGHCYNLGGNNEWENLELAKYICMQMDKINPRDISHVNLIQFVTDRKGHDFRYAIDTTKIKHELNWQPQETFSSGITKTLSFYSKQYNTQSLVTS